MSLAPLCDWALRTCFLVSLGFLERHSFYTLCCPDPSFHLHIVIRSSLPGWLSNTKFHLPGPMHTCWPALQFLAHRNWPTEISGPHHTFSVWFSLYTSSISSASSPCSPLIESNLRFSEMTCQNPQTILCFLISQLKTQVWPLSSRPPSTIFPQFFPVMSRFHVVLSVEQDLLLILIWCSGETVVFIEALFVMPPWRELHSKSSQFSFLYLFLLVGS